MSIITIMIMTMTAIAAAMTTIMSITTMTMTATVAAMIMITSIITMTMTAIVAVMITIMSTIIMTMMMTVAVTIMTMSIIITTMMTSVAVAAMTTTTITKDTIMQMMYLQAGGLENVGVMKKEDLQKILDDLAYGDKYGEVLRAKGMVPSEEKGVWLHFDMVPEQAEIREGAPDFYRKGVRDRCRVGRRGSEGSVQRVNTRRMNYE